LGPTLIVVGMAVVGFRTVARRCSRCGDWAELVEDNAGQKESGTKCGRRGALT
jgi:hypothetical protein